MGKIELLRRFCMDKTHFFYGADLGTQETALQEASRRFGETFFDDPDAIHFANWEQIFEALVRQASEVISGFMEREVLAYRAPLCGCSTQD